MAAYVIVEVQINDPKDYEEYKKLTPSSISAHRGKFIVRGGQTETLEGNWYPERIVILEFPTAEKAKEWWSSEEYARAKKIRQRTATTKNACGRRIYNLIISFSEDYCIKKFYNTNKSAAIPSANNLPSAVVFK